MTIAKTTYRSINRLLNAPTNTLSWLTELLFHSLTMLALNDEEIRGYFTDHESIDIAIDEDECGDVYAVLTTGIAETVLARISLYRLLTTVGGAIAESHPTEGRALVALAYSHTAAHILRQRWILEAVRRGCEARFQHGKLTVPLNFHMNYTCYDGVDQDPDAPTISYEFWIAAQGIQDREYELFASGEVFTSEDDDH